MLYSKAIAHWLWHISVYGDGNWGEHIVAIKIWRRETNVNLTNKILYFFDNLILVHFELIFCDGSLQNNFRCSIDYIFWQMEWLNINFWHSLNVWYHRWIHFPIKKSHFENNIVSPLQSIEQWRNETTEWIFFIDN